MENILLSLITADISQVRQEEMLVKITTLIFIAPIGLLFIGISIPLLYEKIGPNSCYGFRTRKTLSNEEIWYKANKYMGKGFIILGVLQTIYNIWLFASNADIYLHGLFGNLLFLTVGVGIVILISFLYLKKL